MLFRASFKISLWTVFAIIVALVVSYLATDVGLTDWAFGTGDAATNKLNDWKELGRTRLWLNREVIETGLKVIGLAFTVVIGVLAFAQGWYYHKINLPLHLQRYADRIKESLLKDRVVALAPYVSRNLRGEQHHSSAVDSSLMRRIWSSFSSDPATRSARRVFETVPRLDRDILFLAAKLGMCRAHRITAHLITASRLMDTGRRLKSGSTEQASNYASALLEFRAALELDEEDLDALEMTAKLAWLLDTPGQLQQILDKFEKAAHGQREQRPVRYCRALRFQAETLEQRATKAALNSARIKLETALEALDEPDEYDNKVLELALVNEQLAALHLKRGTHTRVTPYLDGADRYYRDVPVPEGPEGTDRVRELRRRLRDAETSADEPEEPEEQADELIRLQPSHVNSDPLPVFESATDAGSPRLVLPPFTGLTVLGEDGDWALIGKGRDRLGFARKINLHTLG